MQPWPDLAIFGLVQLFMLIGLFGLVVPIYPGTIVMWLAALAFGLLKGFHSWGTALFGVITLLMLVSTVADNVLASAGARQGGASWRSIVLAMVVGILGTLIFPPLGGLIGAPLSVLIVEYLRLRDWTLAWKALRGLLSGWGLSLVARICIGAVMMGLWWLWVWVG